VKRFAFRFQRVLETKRHFEELKKNELAALMAQRLHDERRLFSVQSQLLDGHRALAARAEAREVLSDIAVAARYFRKLSDDIRRCEEQLAWWDGQIEAKREELVEARRETRVLDKLEAADRRVHEKAMAGWEQKLIDEVAAGRTARGTHEEDEP